MINQDNWETPQDVFEVFNKLFNFTTDLAATAKNAKLSNYLGPDYPNPLRRDAFDLPWTGSCWLNPPYSWIKVWLKRAYEQSGDVGTTIVIPIAHDHTTYLWTEWSEKVSEIILITGMRIQFIPPPGVIASSNRTGTTLFVFRSWKSEEKIWELNLREALEAN